MIELDSLDLRLVHALQVDGRAPFTRIATVLGVSDQTVARRYSRLRSSRVLRVTGLADPDFVGRTQWYVRVRATPEAALTIANALARRADTSWVMLLAGGTEIISTVETDPGQRGEDLLLSALPRTSKVLDVQAHMRLHQYYGSRTGAIEKLGSLTAEEVDLLREGLPPVPETTRQTVTLDQIDHGILRELAVDGRAGIDHVSAVTSTPALTVRRRMDALRRRGVLFFDVEIDNRLLGRGVEAILWLKVEPAALHEAGVALGMHPEIAFAVACTGSFSILAYVSTSDPASLYRYVTTSVATLPGIREAESAPVIKLIKGPGVAIPV